MAILGRSGVEDSVHAWTKWKQTLYKQNAVKICCTEPIVLNHRKNNCYKRTKTERKMSQRKRHLFELPSWRLLIFFVKPPRKVRIADTCVSKIWRANVRVSDFFFWKTRLGRNYSDTPPGGEGRCVGTLALANRRSSAYYWCTGEVTFITDVLDCGNFCNCCNCNQCASTDTAGGLHLLHFLELLLIGADYCDF